MTSCCVVAIHKTMKLVQEPLAIWDKIVYEPVPGGENVVPENVEDLVLLAGPVQIEDQIIPLLSNENAGAEYAQLEIEHRITHADHHLNRIWDLIAEKSFQYSHVIHVAPRKAVNTRSRAEVKKLNLQISVHCRLYAQCRSTLQKLGASPEIMKRFQILTVEDIKASTAVVNPNERGSTQIKLSWVWQSAGGHRWGLSSNWSQSGSGTGAVNDTNLIECDFFGSHLILSISNTTLLQSVAFTGFVHVPSL